MEKNIEFFNTLNLEDFNTEIKKIKLVRLKKLKNYLDDVYYNTGVSPIEDWRYDILRDKIIEKDPSYKPTIGASLRDKKLEAELPVYLGSMEKIKPEDTNKLTRWISLNRSESYIVSDKLDGVSALLQVKNGKYKMYTRGDATTGTDISTIIPYLNYIPQNSDDIMVRGELVVSIKNFEARYKDKYANPRNMVIGITGAKTARQGLVDVDFVAYEIIYDNLAEVPSGQLKMLKELGFRVVRHTFLEDLTISNLMGTLVEFKHNSPYEIDGIIVQSDKAYVPNTEGNPEYAFAFKMMMEGSTIHTKVKEVIWNISMRGKLKPKVKLTPVKLSGVVISWATGFNAKFIEDNKIGAGAIVEVTRGGEVIPHIVSVVTPATEAEMPEVSYYWNKTHVDIYAKDAGKVMCIKIIHHFFSTLGVKHVAIQTLSRIYDSGGNTLIKLLQMKKEDFQKIEGIGEKSAERIYNNIHGSLQKGIPLYKLMAASSIFGDGIGIKKMKILLQNFPDILTEYKKLDREELFRRINETEGFSDITTNKIIANIKPFDLFLKKIKKYIIVEQKIKTRIQDLSGKKFVFSGVRNKELEEKIENRGGAVTTSVSSKTTAVITNDKTQSTSKIIKAENLAIPIITVSEFTNRFLD